MQKKNVSSDEKVTKEMLIKEITRMLQECDLKQVRRVHLYLLKK